MVLTLTNKQKNFWLITGFVLLWNSGFIGAEYGLPYTGPFTLMFYLYLALTLVMLLYLYVAGKLRWIGWRGGGRTHALEQVAGISRGLYWGGCSGGLPGQFQ